MDEIASGVTQANAVSQQNAIRIQRLELHDTQKETRIAKLEKEKATLIGIIAGIAMASAGSGAVIAKLFI